MSLRGTGAGRDHLRPKAPPEGPICGANSWPYGITVQLVPESKIDCVFHVLARSLFVQLAWCAGHVLRPPAAFQARIGHGTRVLEAETVSFSSRTYSDSDRRADRTARSKSVRAKLEVLRANVSRETIDRKQHIVPFICATESPPQGRRIGMSLSDFLRASGQC